MILPRANQGKVSATGGDDPPRLCRGVTIPTPPGDKSYGATVADLYDTADNQGITSRNAKYGFGDYLQAGRSLLRRFNDVAA